MTRAVVVRYQTTPDATEENKRLVEQVYAELNTTRPDGLRYLTVRLADGVSFVHISLVDVDENPLPGVAAFQAFQAGLGERLTAPPQPSEATIIGSYGF